jgi:hypothetical protein
LYLPARATFSAKLIPATPPPIIKKSYLFVMVYIYYPLRLQRYYKYLEHTNIFQRKCIFNALFSCICQKKVVNLHRKLVNNKKNEYE